MSGLRTALEDYLILRRSLGYKLERTGEELADFVAFLERAGARTVTVDLAIAWATLPPNAESGWRAQRLGMARGFARFQQVFDPDTEVPPLGLLPGRPRRPAPYLYSAAQIASLMEAARGFGSPLRSATVETFIGLLAVTGLRVGEAIRLDRPDVDFEQGLLMVRNSKLGKSRSVPVHPSTTERDSGRAHHPFLPLAGRTHVALSFEAAMMPEDRSVGRGRPVDRDQTFLPLHPVSEHHEDDSAWDSLPARSGASRSDHSPSDRL